MSSRLSWKLRWMIKLGRGRCERSDEQEGTPPHKLSQWIQEEDCQDPAMCGGHQGPPERFLLAKDHRQV